jgi:hypothetical protein
MIQKLAVHPPRVEMLSRKRLFDLRTGHTKSNVSSDSPGPERVPTCATLASGHESNHCSFHTEFSQWTRCFWASAMSR